MKKTRIEIPEEIRDQILYNCDRTCCVCTVKGKSIQIHHIDEDPSNNALSNLAVLCLECHNQTLINGGFGRQLNASGIEKFKSEWIQRVASRRKSADELASINSIIGTPRNHVDNDDYLEYKSQNDSKVLYEYLNKIIIVHKAQLMIAQTNWDSGINAKMNDASYDMIDFYQEVLVELATFYPKGHFNNKSPKAYFSEYISSRFLWHRLVLEPNGPGTGQGRARSPA